MSEPTMREVLDRWHFDFTCNRRDVEIICQHEREIRPIYERLAALVEGMKESACEAATPEELRDALKDFAVKLAAILYGEKSKRRP